MATDNAWSNRRSYGACARLSQDALRQRRTRFFASLRATLRHLWMVDEYDVDGLERAGLGAAVWADEDKHIALEGLWRARRSVDARLLAACELGAGAGIAVTFLTYASNRVPFDGKEVPVPWGRWVMAVLLAATAVYAHRLLRREVGLARGEAGS
jgi:hypothetical protein